MVSSSENIPVALEIGKKRTFASAVDWPGWARAGRDEGSALQALYDYSTRYALVVRLANLDFQEPSDTAVFSVTDRLEGDATTDFGAPGIPLTDDAEPVDESELQRFTDLLEACWEAFDSALRSAEGKELRKGPRGGGRDQDKITQHVLDAEESYLRMVGWKIKSDEQAGPGQRLSLTRRAVLDALVAKAHGELPELGPRGGLRWTARYFVRRVAWHVLDHTWEIEDRILGSTAH